MTTFYTHHPSPVGTLLLVSDGHALTDLHITTGKYVPAIDASWQACADHHVLQSAIQQLETYFVGSREPFSVPLAPRGTAFQQQVWAALRNIPFGETRCYAEQAVAIGSPRAVRAVGAANGRNPIAILIPCHRVVGRDGALTGYAGGLNNKDFLLRLEGAR